MRVEKKNDLYSILLFIPVTVLFYWKTILTSQFTQLASAEAVNQAWSWWQFWIASVRSGSLPIWDLTHSAVIVFQAKCRRLRSIRSIYC